MNYFLRRLFKPTDNPEGADKQIKALRAENKENAVTIKELRETAIYFQENPAVNRYLRFARLCHEMASELKSDAYSAHGVQALPAAAAVSHEVGGDLYCDVIEIPSFYKRALLPTWHPTNINILDHAFEGYLCRASGLLTVGWSLRSQIEHYGPPVAVIPNYRHAEDLEPSNILRERCNLLPSDKLVLSLSTTATGFEAVLMALKLLPDNIHLASLGRLVPASYAEKIGALIQELQLQSRVHIFDQVPYSDLTSVASSADVGLIVRDPKILNNQISLPNRIFDYMSSGVPVVTPKIPDIDYLIKTHNMGISIPGTAPDDWREGILSAIQQSDEIGGNALRASKELVWENITDKLYRAFGYAASMTFFGFNDLTKNNRTMRMARTLNDLGVKITVCTIKDGDEKLIDINGIKIISLPTC